MPLLVATSASGAVVINEVESQPVDFVELYNTGGADVNIGGYSVDDNTPGNPTVIPANTMILAGGFFVMNNPPGLGNPDEVNLFDAGAVEIDSYSYTDHALATWGRCPDGTGAFVSTPSATPGATNTCPPPPPPASIWPGGSAISFADGLNVFGGNLSGLAYQPSGSSAPGVLWASKNNPSTLYRLVWDGAKWTPDTANNWGNGKFLFYPGVGPVGNPDAEGVTLAGGDPNAVYVATERNDTPATEDTSRPAILRFDVSGAGATLNATDDFNLSADLPGLDSNGGLEAITWIPDSVLVTKGFVDDNTGVAYAPGTYPDHGTGLFFVGVEQDGRIIAYALNQTTDTFTRVATIASGLASVMALEFEADTNLLWAACDDNCNGLHLTLDVAQSGPNDGKFVLANAYNRPADMANLNNEGFAITPQAECLSGRKPVFWSEDSNAESHALRAGTLNCAGGGTPPPPPPAADRTPPETKIDSGPKKKTTKKKAKFTFSANEPATFRCKLDKGAFASCTSPATFKAKKKGKHTLQVVATDAAGNVDSTPASHSWKVTKKKKR